MSRCACPRSASEQTEIASYAYNGVDQIVGTITAVSQLRSIYYSPTTASAYPGLDRFNRPIVSDWTKFLGHNSRSFSQGH